MSAVSLALDALIRKYGAIEPVAAFNHAEWKRDFASAIEAVQVESQPAGPEDMAIYRQCASSVQTNELVAACQALIAYCDKNPPMGDSLWSVQRIRAALNGAPRQPAPGFTGMSAECDFETDTWSFKMDPGYRVSGGQYLITRIKAAPKAGEV